MESLVEKSLEEVQQKLALLKVPSPVSFSVLSVSLINDLATDSSDKPGTMIATLRPRFDDIPMSTEMAAKLKVKLSDCSPEDVEVFFKVSYVENLTRMMLDEAIDTTTDEPSLNPVLAAPAPDTEVMFVVNRSGKLIFGVRPHDVRRPHPTLVGEDDPEVLNGGTITMRDGLIYEVRDDSGHFQPSSAGFESLLRAFSALPGSTFHPDFQGFKPFGGPAVVPDWTDTTTLVKARVAYGNIRNDARLLADAIQSRIDNDNKILTNTRILDKIRALNTALSRHQGAYDALVSLLEGVTAFADSFSDALDGEIDGISIIAARAYAQKTLKTVETFLVRTGDAANESDARDFISQNHDVLTQIHSDLMALP
jgi:hypothetical protein